MMTLQVFLCVSRRYSYKKLHPLKLNSIVKLCIVQRNFIQSFKGLLTENLFPSKSDDLTVSNTLLTEVSTHLLNHLSSKSVDSTESSKTVKYIPDKEMKSQSISSVI